MKLFVLFIVLVAFSFQCGAQDLALLTPPKSVRTLLDAPPIYPRERTHRQSTLGSIGTWTMLGGVAVAIVGLVEVKNGTKSDGPFTVVNQSQINAGHGLEIIGGGLFTAGLTMLIIDAVNRRHRGSGLGVIAPKYNEVGVAYRF